MVESRVRDMHTYLSSSHEDQHEVELKSQSYSSRLG